MSKEFVRWFLHGNINGDIIVNGMGWVLIFFFIGFPCILLCLAYYGLRGGEKE